MGSRGHVIRGEEGDTLPTPMGTPQNLANPSIHTSGVHLEAKTQMTMKARADPVTKVRMKLQTKPTRSYGGTQIVGPTGDSRGELARKKLLSSKDYGLEMRRGSRRSSSPVPLHYYPTAK